MKMEEFGIIINRHRVEHASEDEEGGSARCRLGG